MSTIDVNGQTINYTDTGADDSTDAAGGTAVVYSHGALMDASMWQAQIDALAPTRRAIAWDARLHGGTVDSGPEHTAWDSARDLIALLDALDVGRAVLVGHSQGGFVSLRAALLAPERVSALVLIDTMATAWPEPAIEQMTGARAGFAAAGPDAVAPVLLPKLIGRDDLQEQWLAKWRTQPNQRLADAMSVLMSADDVSPRLQEITAPALVIHGEDDQIIPLAAGHALHAALPAADEIHVVPGVAHTPPLSHPDLVTPALAKFLDEIAGQG